MRESHFCERERCVHFNLARIMSRAWAIFREAYHYPSIPFSSIGRKCFAGTLRKAWHEARCAAELMAAPVEMLESRAASLRSEIDGLKYRGWGSNIERLERDLRSMLSPIEAEIARRPVTLALAA